MTQFCTDDVVFCKFCSYSRCPILTQNCVTHCEFVAKVDIFCMFDFSGERLVLHCYYKNCFILQQFNFRQASKSESVPVSLE